MNIGPSEEHTESDKSDAEDVAPTDKRKRADAEAAEPEDGYRHEDGSPTLASPLPQTD